MLRVYAYVFGSISLLFVYMCVRMPLSSRSAARVPSGRALPGFPITADSSRVPYYWTPPVCVSDLIGGLTVWQHNNNKKKKAPVSGKMCLPPLSCVIVWDWFGLRCWLIHKGVIWSRTASLFWNIITLLERPRMRSVRKIGSQNQSVVCI